MELQVGVKALLRDSSGKYLLIYRSPDKYPDIDGRWDIVGGRINPGLGLKENLQREIEEETSLSLVGEPKLIAAQDILRVSGRHIIRLTYVADVKGEPKLSDEHLEFKWFSYKELRNLDDLDTYVKELLGNGII